MTQKCGNWLQSVGKWVKYLTSGLNIWEMTQRFGKWVKYVGNGLDIWGTT